MEISLTDGDGALEVADSVFAVDYNPALVHQLVTLTIARGHTGTKQQKNRAAVRGGGRKPWRQKGMNRARAGTRSSPIWRGGGVTFPAIASQQKQIKVNRKMFRGAMRCVLSNLLREGRLQVRSSLGIDSGKTKDLKAFLSEADLSDVLFVDVQENSSFSKAARNLPNIEFLNPSQLNPANLVGASTVIASSAAIKAIEEGLAT